VKQGLMMGTCEFIKFSAIAAVAMVMAFPQCAAAAAEPDKSDLSEKSVRVITGFALTTIPSEVRQSDGSVMKIDKSDVSKIILPYDDAKHVIKAAWLSAKAQECDMAEVQTDNYHKLMHEEQAKNKWTKEQLLFINRLHLFTVMWLTGNVRFSEKDGQKEATPMSEAEIAAAAKAKERVCTDDEKEKIKTSIDSFWKSAQK
jgi:hypothetical protein